MQTQTENLRAGTSAREAEAREAEAREAEALDADEVVQLLDPSADRALVGGKAAPLARAAAAGHRVPAGFVVTTRASVTTELSRWLAELGPGPFAVRSSAVSEDSAARSFAGQLETILGVDAGDVPRAIERCRASASALRVLAYAGTPGEVAVIVQRMVPAKVAGVAFSADPRTGERGVAIVEAVRGLGDRLVGGEVDPEAWRCTEQGCARTRRADGDVLDDGLAARVAELARSLEQLFGAPQDVEWAFDGETLWLLQSRPITALPAAPVPIELVLPEGDWERDDHHGVLSPLGWTWFAPYPKAMAANMGKLMPIKEMRTKLVGGHLYLQMAMGGGDGPMPPKWILWLATRLVPSMRRANRACVELVDRESFVADLDAWDREGRAALAAATDALFDPAPGELSDPALLARIRAVLDHTARGLAFHAALGGPGVISVGKLVLFVEDELGWEANRALALVRGSSRQTSELHRRLEAIVAEHEHELGDGAFPHTWGELFDRCPAMGSALADWLAQNQLRMMHYDPKHASLGERPELVLAIAASILAGRRGGEAAPEALGADDELAEARAQLTPERFAELERLVGIARRGYALRDENGIETVSRPAGLLRWYVRELGRRLPLEAPEHAVYLAVDEHEPALAGELADLRERVDRRRGEESWALFHRGPRRYGKAPPPMPPTDAFPAGLGKMMRIFGWMMKAEEVPEPEAGDALRGVGIGTRIVTGRARVIDRPEQLVTLRHGEVLVCRITSPEWSVALGRVAAIVTNEGGLLSHPAIIAREYGVTAVVGAGPATDRIQTGDRVRVDPVASTVVILDRP